MEIEVRGKDKTKFTLQNGLYLFLRMLLGLKNIVSAFQLQMEIKLSSLKEQFLLVYLHDVVIFLRSLNQHLQPIRTVLRLLSRAGVSLTLTKYFSFEDCIEYLGHVIQPCTLRISTEAGDAIDGLQYPINLTEFSSFLCLCNGFRRLKPKFARIGTLVVCKLEMDQPFHFGQPNKTVIEALETHSSECCHYQ